MAKLKTAFVILVLTLSVALLCACAKTGQYFIFGTFVDIKIDGAGGGSKLKEVESKLKELESRFSVALNSSEVYKINSAKAGEAVAVSDELLDILKVCEEVYNISNGLFDITVLPLVELWGFDAAFYNSFAPETLPDIEEIRDTLEYVGFDKITIDYEGKTVVKSDDRVKIDVGAVAKGYAVGAAANLCGSLKSLINIGGNIAAVNGEYKIGIASPREGKAYFGSFELKAGQTVSTSGDYERCYFKDGVRYCHVINPKTGLPAGVVYDDEERRYKNEENPLISATVITEGKYSYCDAISTALLLLGFDKGEKLLKELGLKGVLIKADLNYTAVCGLELTLK
ncbi:MAG: FAD:protein FMN transferase [Clostridiales bacterium]|nr:FAD:protein FMN transferase [Clostridiales bacterium]